MEAMGEAELCCLSRMVEEQRGAIGALKRDLAACREELGALRDCLISEKLLDKVRFLVHLHRVRFAAARARHGLSLDVHVDTVIDVRHITFAVGLFAGPTAMRALREASTLVSPAAADIMGALCPGHVYVCGGFEGALALNSVERLDPTAGGWEVLPPMMEARQYTCAGVVSGRIYVCGGWGGPQPVRSVERFDPQVNAWQAMPPMLMARWGASAGVVGGKLHICGGLDESRQPLSSVERLDPALAASTATVVAAAAVAAAASLEAVAAVMGGREPATSSASWEVVAPMSERRGWPAAGVLGGWLYVCGGRDEQREPLSSAERLGPASLWEPLPPMAGQRAGAAAAAAAGRLYVCGGAFGAQMLSSAERFNPKASAWESLPPMAARRAYVAASAVAGRLHVFGGSDGGQCRGSAEQFDPVSGLWSPLPSMSERRSGAAAAAVLI